jgi:sigma-B regulation protein RsbU (phosphoserine phosphatase)
MKKPSHVARLEQKVKRLSSLIEVNGIISSSLNLDQILENVMSISKQVMNADASSLMLIDEKTNELVYEVALGKVGEKLKQEFRLKKGQGIAGAVAEDGKPLLLEDAYTHPKFYRGHDEATGYRTKSMITVPLKVGERITGVAQVINRLDDRAFDQDDLDLFIALCSLAAIAIENAKMHKSLMEKQRLVKDMEFARTVQESFLPQKTAPKVEQPPGRAKQARHVRNAPVYGGRLAERKDHHFECRSSSSDHQKVRWFGQKNANGRRISPRYP